MEIRQNWSIEEVSEIYHSPLLDLVYKAAAVHRQYHPSGKIKLSTLISVKTGGCVEDCAYCAQSSRYQTHVTKPHFLSKEETIKLAQEALDKGVPRVCLSASWKNIPHAKFNDLLDTIRTVKKMGLDVCLTMGTVDAEQAKALADAGVTAYNHNLDTSKENYANIITTRTFEDRVNTLNTLIDAGLQHCSGGIIGLGETDDDRISMLHTLATLKKHPYSVPLNTLIPIAGTPLANNSIVSSWDIIRMVATTRILMPATHIELAAGRVHMTDEAQAMCYMAGATSIFVGDKLLTTDNPESSKDKALLAKLGLHI